MHEETHIILGFGATIQPNFRRLWRASHHATTFNPNATIFSQDQCSRISNLGG
jgi:hypothetical protein